MGWREHECGESGILPIAKALGLAGLLFWKPFMCSMTLKALAAELCWNGKALAE